jgi:hypothetical protein
MNCIETSQLLCIILNMIKALDLSDLYGTLSREIVFQDLTSNV